MSETPQDSGERGPLSGLLQSLTQALATLVAMTHTRLELLSAEVQEEVRRGASMLLWAFVALFAAGIGLFMGALAIVFAFWDSHRILAAVLVTVLFFALAAVAGWRLRQLSQGRRLLDATLSELEQDRQRLETRLRERG